MNGNHWVVGEMYKLLPMFLSYLVYSHFFFVYIFYHPFPFLLDQLDQSKKRNDNVFRFLIIISSCDDHDDD